MHKFIALVGLFLVGTNVCKAQCAHTPTVFPSLIMCPNSQDTLFTQSYDSYQWYKDGSMIAGATNPYYVVNAATDVGSVFAVEATLAGCAELSADVLVDGWVFLLPYIISQGSFQIIGSGQAQVCDGDTMYLIMGSPYERNIQWTNNGFNITGANDDTLVVTSSGQYSCSGAPALCPNYIANVGVTVDVVVVNTPPTPAPIFFNGLQLETTIGYTYQWFLNGAPLPGATGWQLTPIDTGTYTVELTNSAQCSSSSDPYYYLNTTLHQPNKSNYWVRFNNDQLLVSRSTFQDESLVLYDLLGHPLFETTLYGQYHTIDLPFLEKGCYIVKLGNVTFPVLK
jgi:hypothetical protein